MDPLTLEPTAALLTVAFVLALVALLMAQGRSLLCWSAAVGFGVLAYNALAAT